MSSRTLPAYRNRKGEEFMLEERQVLVPRDADYWGYYVVSKHTSWGERAFAVFVKKEIAATRNDAERIVEGPALTEVHRRLDEAGAEGVPLVFSETLHTLGYAVF